jgi:hypothetical protein
LSANGSAGATVRAGSANADEHRTADGNDILPFEQATAHGARRRRQANASGKNDACATRSPCYFGEPQPARKANTGSRFTGKLVRTFASFPTLGDFRVLDRLTISEIEQLEIRVGGFARRPRRTTTHSDAHKTRPTASYRSLSRRRLNEAFADDANGLPSDNGMSSGP